jgi:hypothetical protein
MLKKHKYINLFLLAFFIPGMFFTSCSFIARFGYGVKKPRTENEESIKRWLFSHGLAHENLFSVAPEYYYEFIPGLSQAPLLFDAKSGSFLALSLIERKT